MKRLRQMLAKRRLARMVARNRGSFSYIDYRRRREAALKGRNRIHSTVGT